MEPKTSGTSEEGSDYKMGARGLPPIIESPHSWQDITCEFFESTQELNLGELLHDDFFDLFGAMSAIEMMDPKMDAGMLCNRGKAVLNFDQAVKAGVLKLNNLTMEELVGIIDSIFACLVTWLEGHSSAQTVFTCLYLHKPLSIEDRALRAFCIQTLKLLGLVNNIVQMGYIWEEEDFQPGLYMYSVCPEVTEARAGGMMREVEEELQRSVKSTRNKQGEVWDPKVQKQHEDSVALFSRIRFLRLFCSALSSLKKREPASLQEAERGLASCSELISIMQNTINRGLKPKTTKDEDGNKVDYPTIMGFEPLINQRLLPSTFPRYTKLKTRKEAMYYLEDLVTRIRQTTKITHCDGLHSALDFLDKSSDKMPCVLSRSLAQVLYLGAWGGSLHPEVLRSAPKTFICPPALLPKAPVLNDPQAAEYVNDFFAACSQTFEQLFIVCGQNRARQREKIAKLLEEFAFLQFEADKVDAFLHQVLLRSDQPRPHLAYFGTWILYHTLKLMIKYLLTGFTLELYSVHEYHYIYWYLYEYVYVWLVSALSRADAMLLEQATYDSHRAGKHQRSKSRHKTKNKHRPYGKQIDHNTGLQHLCGGYYQTMVGLKLAGKIRYPYKEFDNEQVRYDHRFKPFRVVLTPPPVPYQQFASMTDLSNYKEKPLPTTIYHDAKTHFHKAKAAFESISNPSPEVTQLIKIAKTNFVVLKLLEGGHKSDDNTQPTFDFSTHPCFPIIKIT